MLHDRGRDVAVLADFGLAARADVRPGVVGTTGYLAPELIDRPASVPSEVFALAASLFHLITGAPPFAANDPYTSLTQAQAGLPQPLPALSPFPRGIEEAIRAGLEPEPDRRPDLEKFLLHLRTAHLHELAEELDQLNRAATCPVRLDVTIARADPGDKLFREVFRGNSHDQKGAAAERPVVRARTGDSLRILARADAPGFLTVLNFDCSGDIKVAFPNRQNPHNEMRPGENLPFTGIVDPSPVGDHLVILWTRGPNTLPPTVWRERISSEIRDIRGALLPLPQPIRAETDQDWTAVAVGLRPLPLQP